jgi:hypothetical protein
MIPDNEGQTYLFEGIAPRERRARATRSARQGRGSGRLGRQDRVRGHSGPSGDVLTPLPHDSTLPFVWDLVIDRLRESGLMDYDFSLRNDVLFHWRRRDVQAEVVGERLQPLDGRPYIDEFIDTVADLAAFWEALVYENPQLFAEPNAVTYYPEFIDLFAVIVHINAVAAQLKRILTTQAKTRESHAEPCQPRPVESGPDAEVDHEF